MAILRTKQIRGMTPKDLDSKLNDLKLELVKESGNIKMGKPIKNTGRVGELKRTIARLETVKHEIKVKSGVKKR